MECLIWYDLPGNVRELQHFIERAVILSPGTTLCAPLVSLKQNQRLDAGAAATLEQAETDLIVNTLRETNWIIGGSKGAAAKLGLKRNTLIAKMQKLGITRSA